MECRAVLYSYLESLILLRPVKPAVFESEQARIVELFTASKNDLIATGYDEFAFETFYDVSDFSISHISYCCCL